MAAWVERLLPWTAALLGTAFFHRYTLITAFDAVQADKGDSRFVAFLLEHWNAVLHGHARIGSPLIFFPVQGTLGYSDALAGMAPLHLALRAAALDPFTAMNVQLVLLSLLSFAAAYWFLARGFRLGPIGATVGGYFFAFCWPRFAELVHVQMQFTCTIPLIALLTLECLRDGPHLARFGFAWRSLGAISLLALTMVTTVYFAEFILILLILTLIPTLAFAPAQRHYVRIAARHWPGLLAATAFAALLAWPIARLYLPILRQSGGRTWPEIQTFLLDPIDLIWLGRENYAWSWAFQHWHDLSVAKWAGKRVGIGLIATLAWLAACFLAARTLWLCRPGRPPPDRNRAIAALIVLATLTLQLSTIRIGDASLWWLIWKIVPGVDGLRAIGRVQLVAALPMALAFAILVDQAWHRRGSRWIIAGLIGLAAIEQTGMVQRYSARDAFALSRRVTDAIPPACKAAYVLGTKDMLPQPPNVEDEAKFDAPSYLKANPDVAAAWKGSAWEHYVAYGRREHRALDPDSRFNQLMMMYFYNYTIPLGAALAGIPVVNGISGWQPPGWDLFDVFAPDADQKLALWLSRNHIQPTTVCTISLNIPYQTLPSTELWTD